MKAVLLGYGIENQSIVSYLSVIGFFETMVCHMEDSPLIDTETDGLSHRAYDFELIKSFEPNLIIRSPGISIYSDELIALKQLSCEITTSTGYWLKCNTRQITIGVTGTKGKSSTANFIFKLLGDSAELAGNIGLPVWNMNSATKYVVLELSSFMTSDLLVSTDYAILTTLSSEHLDWHRNQSNYINDKLNLFETKNNSGKFPISFAPKDLHTILSFDYLFDLATPDWFSELARDMPAHIAYDLFMALEVVEKITNRSVDQEVVEKIINEYKPLKGRMRTVYKGRNTWIDDTLSSNPFGTSAAVSSIENSKDLVLIVGGKSRGVSLGELKKALNVRDGKTTLIGISQCGKEYLKELDFPKSKYFMNLKDAIDHVSENFKDAAVLFSPAAPTPKGEGNWEKRSDLFEKLVLGVENLV